MRRAMENSQSSITVSLLNTYTMLQICNSLILSSVRILAYRKAFKDLTSLRPKFEIRLSNFHCNSVFQTLFMRHQLTLLLQYLQEGSVRGCGRDDGHNHSSANHFAWPSTYSPIN